MEAWLLAQLAPLAVLKLGSLRPNCIKAWQLTGLGVWNLISLHLRLYKSLTAHTINCFQAFASLHS
jgi:hypothetical protein